MLMNWNLFINICRTLDYFLKHFEIDNNNVTRSVVRMLHSEYVVFPIAHMDSESESIPVRYPFAFCFKRMIVLRKSFILQMLLNL